VTRRELLRFQRDICDQANALMSRKNQDYATGDNVDGDVFANFRMSEEKTSVPVATGMLVRLSDKLSRLGHLLQPGYKAKVRDESVKDTILDIINYAVLIEAYQRNGQTAQVPTSGNGFDPEEALLPQNRWCRGCD